MWNVFKDLFSYIVAYSFQTIVGADIQNLCFLYYLSFIILMPLKKAAK